MITSYVVLLIMCCSAFAFSLEYDNVCHYNYDYKCASQANKHTTTYNNEIQLCTLEYIPKEVNFTIMSDEKNSSSRGVINVDFKSPNVPCTYKVILFINPYINNSEDCKNYLFNKDNQTKIHTLEKTICPSQQNKNKNEQLVDQTNSVPCKDVLNLWFEYIYTGCYSLGFKVAKEYIFVGNEFLKTEYQKTEVTEPKLRCSYKSSYKRNSSNIQLVTMTTDISLLAGSTGLRLEVAQNPLSYKKEENVCNRYSEHPMISLLLGMSMDNDTDAVNNSCTLTTKSLSSGDLAKSIECNFMFENSFKDIGYCFLVRILDERCSKNTSWNPPIKDKIPCAWAQNCLKTEEKMFDNTEEIKIVEDEKISKVSRMLFVFIVVAAILIVLIVLSTIFIAYRIRVQRRKNLLNGKLKAKDFDDEASAVLELNGTKSQKEKLVKESGIIILYVRESDQFMTFMAQFRKFLKKHTGCDVHDWWAPELWNDVARLGGYDWVIKMIRKDCRVIWVDTYKARALFAVQHKNGYNQFKQLKRSENNLEISDFRESVFPAIVDFAKRNNHDIEQEYQKHFVIRLETFDDADKTEDPFADLSPHARYLIPCHFDKLCYQLSAHDAYLEDEVNVDKIHLSKYLFHDIVTNS